MSREDKVSCDELLTSVTKLFGDERVHLLRQREAIAEATIGLLDEVGKVHVRIAELKVLLVVRPDLSRLLNDTEFWVEVITGWKMLDIGYEDLQYSPKALRRLAGDALVRQSLMQAYLTEWTKALFEDHRRTQ